MREETHDRVQEMQEPEREASEVKVSRKALNAVIRRMLLFENSVNFERMQSLAYTFTMIPVLKELYKKKEDLSQALMRHLQFFNCNVFTAPLITGVTVAMEEQKANGKEISDDSINSMKAGLMGPGSGIGDALFWGTFVPIVGGIAASMGQDGNIFGPILHQIIRIGVFVAAMYFFVNFGYKQGINLFQYVGKEAVNKISRGATVLASVVIGGLVASLVTAQTPIAWSSGEVEIKLQEIFDQILPNLIPLSLFFLLFFLLNKLKWSPILVIVTVFVLGIAASYFNLLVIPE